MKCEIKFATFNTNSLVILSRDKVLQIINNEKKLKPKFKKSQEALTGSCKRRNAHSQETNINICNPFLIMQQHINIKNNMLVLGLLIWNNLQDILLSEKSKRQNNMCSVLLFVWEKISTHSHTPTCVCLYASLLVYV